MPRALFFVSCAAVAWAWGCGREGAAPLPVTGSEQSVTANVSSPRTAAPAQLQVEVPPPPFSEGVFPCSECHNEADLPPNRTRRPLSDAHDEIVLKHDEEQRWCLDCHDTDNRDRLRLASGELVQFDESYRVCGQCHGEKYRDWRAGVHGRRIGEWNGSKQYLLCVHCHSPHQPRFKSLAPQPAPHRPMRSVR
jgi:Cytochrome c7 and related cytochrome c